ncbi:MAG TPA: SRPBCC family protein [Polyangiales bacterium]|nr:SRPBCC family protein [Polyangiales bacterium]
MPHLSRLILALALLLGSAAQAQAESRKAPAYDARRDRLEGLSKTELAGLAPLLEQGPIALVEFADMQADQLPAINIALRVNVGADALTKLIIDPGNYPSFMPTMDSVKVLARDRNAIVYEWSFDLAVLHLSGRNTMTLYPTPPGRDTATRITIDSDEGDMGRGRFLLRVYPQGPKQSLLVVSMRLDLREANYVARQMAKAARSINRSANLALTMSMALNLRREAERRGGYKAPDVQLRGLDKPVYDLRSVAPLLTRGDLLFFNMSGDQLNQISVVGAIDQSIDKVHEVMHDANAFGSSLVPGSAAKVISQKDGVTTFDWNIDLPLVGVSGQMQMSEKPPVVAIEATSGALQGGRWLFELTAPNPKVTVVTGWARFDFSNSTWLLQKIMQADRFFGVGMTGASEVMLVRALRSRSTK